MHLTPRPRKIETTPGRSLADTAVPQTRVDPDAVPQPEGYRLNVRPDGVEIVGHDPAGVFYGRQTWQQLTRDASPRWGGDGTVACVTIEDWPDFRARGVMLDISRDRVPTTDTLFALIDQLAHFKINQLQLYTEHTFAYAGHEVVWERASPITPDEMRTLDAYCGERFIELVPNQNCFGHFERWLKHPEYAEVSERPKFLPGAGDDVPNFYRGRVEHGTFGHTPGMGSTLCPVEPKSAALVDDLLTQLLPCAQSKTINVGGDETFDLGFGRSREACKNKGKGRVYLDYLEKLHALCAKHAHQMQFWGDMAWHHPELLPEVAQKLPGATALNWGYEKHQDFEKEAKLCADAGVPFFVCPATATFNALTGRIETATVNQKNAAKNGLKYGAIGYLNTWWGDWGHWQPKSVNDPGLVLGAAVSWCYETNRELDLEAALSRHVYDDPTGNLAAGLTELGRVELDVADIETPNALGWSLVMPECPLVEGWLDRGWDKIGPFTTDNLEAVAARLKRGVALLEAAEPACADGPTVLSELRNAADLLGHAAKNLRARLTQPCAHTHELGESTRAELEAELAALLQEFERCWDARSRPGGRADSTARFRKLRQAYGQPIA